MSPRERYQRDLQRPGFILDPDQMRVVDVLDTIHVQLLQPYPLSRGWLPWTRRQVSAVPGLYLWGGVGRGKTYLVDTFFEGLPFTQKNRMHYQRLMQQVHARLAGMRRHPDPLPEVAQQFARDCRVLCIDEFHVDDVGDAMLLAGLLRALLDLGVTLLFTSNIAPESLYLNGLQRDRFLPAIELIKANTAIVYLGGTRDYRMVQDRSLSHFCWSTNTRCDDWLATTFQSLTGNAARYNVLLEVNARIVRARGCAPGVIWFDFDELCATARSANDYLYLCNKYTTLMLENINSTNDESADTTARFIQLVDAVYDHDVQLWASSSFTLDEWYTGQTLAFDFQRARSRLQELLGHRAV